MAYIGRAMSTPRYNLCARLLQAAVDTKHGWPALGGAGWAAAAKAPVAQVQQPPPPPPPVEASMQEWPELPGASSADVGEVMRAGVVAPVAPVAAQLQRKGSTMAAELARAASAPQGAAAAAKEPAGRPTSGNTVLVVPKKKQAPVAGGKTPKKATGEAGAAAAKQQDPTRAADERTSTSTPSVEAPDAPSQAAVAAVQKAVEDDVRKIEAGATTHEQPSKSEHVRRALHIAILQVLYLPLAVCIPVIRPEVFVWQFFHYQGQREEVIVAQAEGSKPDEGLVWVDNSKPKVPKAGPPPGFDGAAKANGRPKKVFAVRTNVMHIIRHSTHFLLVCLDISICSSTWRTELLGFRCRAPLQALQIWRISLSRTGPRGRLSNRMALRHPQQPPTFWSSSPQQLPAQPQRKPKSQT